MDLIETASGRSVWRGLDYYNQHKVISWEKSGHYTYEGKVSGTDGNEYTVHVDTDHPKRSKCNCAFASGRRVVCKHMIALYFTAEPKEAELFLKRVEEWEKEEEEREQERLDQLRKYVHSLTKAELREQLFNLLSYQDDRYGSW